MAPNQKTPAEAVKEMGPEATKWDIRDRVWDYLEENDLVQFPRPVHNRIPNFKTSATASELVPTMEEFKKAKTVKINPDKPQEQARYLTLDAHKTLLVPTPRLRDGLFNKIMPPADCNKETLRICSTTQGIREYSTPISLEDKVKIDLVILGSVAVSRQGFRIGKGEGFADLEYGMMTAMGAVDKDTVVITTVHEDQIVDVPERLVEEHDVSVDYIVTPNEIIKCDNKRAKPVGIYWSKLDERKLNRIPVLKKLKAMDEEAGKDVTLKPTEEREEEKEGDEGQERRYRQNYRRGRGGYRGGFRGRGGRRFGGPRRRRPRYSNRSESESEEKRDEVENGDQGGESEEHSPDDKTRRRRPRTRRFRRNRRPRDEEESEGDVKQERSENDDTMNESNEQPRRPYRPRFRRPRRGRQPSIFVGGLPRSVRVSEFKAKVRENSVDPLRVIWHGGNGHAFLQFEDGDKMQLALEALAELDIKGKKLRVEKAKGRGDQKGLDSTSDSHKEEKTDDVLLDEEKESARD